MPVQSKWFVLVAGVAVVGIATALFATTGRFLANPDTLTTATPLMTTNSAQENEASLKERFDLLYARLKSIHDVFIDVVFKATAAFLLATGWIVTSDVAQRHLQRDPVTRWLAIACLFVYAGLFLVAAHRTARSCQRVSERLDELDYMSPVDYSDVIVPNAVALTFGAANAALCLAVAVFLYRLAA